MPDTIYDRMLRKQRESDPMWSEDQELTWLRRHPEDRPSGWVDPEEQLSLVADADLIPDIEINKTIEDDLTPILDGLDILDAYIRFCGKMTPNPGSRTEGIKVSCPDPSHPDKNPSAWINTKNQTWFCGGCQVGGDKYDIFALNRGWGCNYKPEFKALRRAMAEELGWVAPIEGFVAVPDAPQSESDDGTDINILNSDISENPEPVTVVPFKTLTLLPEVELQGLQHFKIDWKAIVPPQTFLWDWMQATAEVDDLPHEYYFWLGIMALGFASGSDVWMPDQIPIKPNFFVCTYGRTGSGKSRSGYNFKKLLEEALPWTGDDFTESKGVQVFPSPGSAESLLKSFSHEILDPSTMKPIKLAPVRGLVQVEELAAFISKASRIGGTLKERLIELYDCFDLKVGHASLSSGKIFAQSPFAQMLTTTQPKAIHTFTSKADIESGFLNRWVFAIGPRRIERRSHGGANIDISDAVLSLRRAHTWSGRGWEMHLSGDALKVWDKFFKDHVLQMVEYSEESIFSRADLILKKLMLCFCINEEAALPTPEIVEKVSTLLSYMQSSWGVFSDDITYSDFDDCVRKVVATVERLSKKDPTRPCTKRDISRTLSKSFSSKMIVDAIKTASDLGLLSPATNRTAGVRGRPAEGFVITQ